MLSELRRRNVFRMAVLYLGAAWLVLQVVDLLIDRGPLPETLGQVMWIVLAIGFPIALIISWFYEVTPEGILPDEQAAEQRGAAAPPVQWIWWSLPCCRRPCRCSLGPRMAASRRKRPGTSFELE